MIVRLAAEADRDAILELVAAAFGGGEAEVAIVRRVWGSPEHLPDLELVADEDGAVVGHVLLSTGQLGNAKVVGLGPLAVIPARQRSGIGIALMDEALHRADAAGYELVVLLGHPTYYPRFGFESATSLGIQPPFPLKDDSAFMARRLSAYEPSHRGQFTYAPAFD
jgi:putative acetyltransferase